MTGLEAYLAQEQANQQQSMGNLQMAQVAQSLQAGMEKQRADQQLKTALADSGGDVEKALAAALQSGNVAAAHQLAPLVKLAQEKRQRESMANMGQMTPDQLDVLGQNLAASGHPGAATVMTIADRRRKQLADTQTVGAMQSRASVQPDPQEVQQSADQGTPAPQPTAAQQGLFGPLLQSEVPGVAAHAKMLQDQLDRSPHIPAAYWEKARDYLAGKETAYLQKEAAAERNRPDRQAYTNVQSDGKGGWIGLSRASGQMEQIPTKPGVQGSGHLGDDAIAAAAQRYLLDGSLPPNLGRGTQGSVNTANILDRAAAVAKERGDAPEEQRLTQLSNKANAQALGQLEKQRNLISAFKKNAVANADLVLETSAQVDRLGSPAIDRWIQAGKKNLAGDEGVAKLDTAMRTFVNEYARITTSVTGGGITSDAARREIDQLLRSAMTKEQVIGVINLMKREMDNRDAGYQQQVAELKGRIRPTNAALPAAPTAPTPAPQGTVLEFDAQGNPVKK